MVLYALAVLTLLIICQLLIDGVESTLIKLFPYTDIMRDATNDIYLRRFFIYPRNKVFKKLAPRIYLHKFYRGDEDPHLHDHPWPFTSLILTRGYWEETPFVFMDPNLTDDQIDKSIQLYVPGTNDARRQIWYPRFSLLRRPAIWRHRVVLQGTKPVWTIVRTGVKERSWGFWVADKLCPWKEYNNGVCWCGDETSAPGTQPVMVDRMAKKKALFGTAIDNGQPLPDVW